MKFFTFCEYNFINFRRYFFLYLNILIKTFLIFFIFLLFFFLSKNFKIFVDVLTEKIEMGVFLKNSQNESKDIENYKEKIYSENKDIIKTINFIDKDKAFNDFLDEYNFLKDENYEPFINKNLVKSYFLIQFHDIDILRINKFKKDIEKLNFVDDIIYKENLIKFLDKFFIIFENIIKILFFILVIVLVFKFFSNVNFILSRKKNEFYILDILGIEENFLSKIILFESVILGIILGISGIFFVKILYLFLLKFSNKLQFFNILEQFIIIICEIIFFYIQNVIVYLKGKNEKIFY